MLLFNPLSLDIKHLHRLYQTQLLAQNVRYFIEIANKLLMIPRLSTQILLRLPQLLLLDLIFDILYSFIKQLFLVRVLEDAGVFQVEIGSIRQVPHELLGPRYLQRSLNTLQGNVFAHGVYLMQF